MKLFTNRFFSKLIIIMVVLVLPGMNRNCQGLFAQASIGFTSTGLQGMPDSAYSNGNTIYVGADLKNYDSTFAFPSTDTLQIIGYIDTTAAPIPIAFPLVSNITIPPGDSIHFALPFVFLDQPMGGNFRIGNNVIVIWPVIYDPNVTTHDSVSVNIFIIDPNGVPEYNHEEAVRFYPVPANGPLYVTTGTRSVAVKQVVVRDAAGKIVAISDTPALGIKTDDWASGIYILEITFENGKKSNYKIIR
ncbi:MAG TPA: T9SS type A sorting domain-containing protein [Bacteroidia bacterium]|nr:T9SS type A sorting domain-containing protein [Bacteroidia bacterium]